MAEKESFSTPAASSTVETKAEKLTSTAVFERDFAKLVAFKEKHGHCNLPNTANYEPDRSFGHRIQEWRRRGHKNTLKAEQKQQLKELGFIFDPIDQKWQDTYDELSKCLDERGCDITAKELNAVLTKSISSWVTSQRRLFKTGMLDDDRQAKLLSIQGFLVKGEDGWDDKFEALKAFLEKHEQCDQEDQDTGMDKELSRWIYKQRILYKHNKLSDDHKSKLEGIAFDWSLATKTASTVKKDTSDDSEPEKDTDKNGTEKDEDSIGGNTKKEDDEKKKVVEESGSDEEEPDSEAAGALVTEKKQEIALEEKDKAEGGTKKTNKTKRSTASKKKSLDGAGEKLNSRPSRGSRKKQKAE